MKVELVDVDGLRAVSPIEATGYLRATGWTLLRQDPRGFAIYQRAVPESDEGYEVDVPLRSEFRDYAQRLRDVLHNLAIVEGRSQLDIFQDIHRATVDTVRLGLVGASRSSENRIGLEVGARVIAQARDLLLAAACSAIAPRAAFGRRKPERALEFVRGVRLGPSEAGSYVLTLESPVAPRPLDVQTDLLDGEPFERRVTLTLAIALERVRDLVANCTSSGRLEPFLGAVDSGVSSNLCEALAGVLKESEAERVYLSTRWAPTRPTLDRTLPPTLHFHREDTFVLHDAARLLEAKAPIQDFELVGFVHRLESPEAAVGGAITVSTLLDGSPRLVRVQLLGDDYRLAIRAHAEEARIACEGELVREGRMHALRFPRSLRILAED